MINDFTDVRLNILYKDEVYDVRDNGAVYRHRRKGKRLRKNDEVWTLGVQDKTNGYMYIGSHRIHIIVARAFYGERDSKEYVVDHIDTLRWNNRVENLRWFTRLENVLNNEITRNKIIRLCKSIDAFINNPKILQEKIRNNQSLSWLKPLENVTQEELAIAYENLKKYWEEQARNPQSFAGGRLDERVFQKQNDTKLQYAFQSNNSAIKGDSASNIITTEEWLERTKSLREPYEEVNKEVYVRDNYIQSLTPNAAQIVYFYNDKPSYYPCTPQGKYENPLQAYSDALKVGAVFWQNHEGKRGFSAEKWGLSSDGHSLVVLTRSTYVWRKDDCGNDVEVAIATLEDGEYSDNEILYSLNEVVFKDGLYIHKRPETGFTPKEYLIELYNEMTHK